VQAAVGVVQNYYAAIRARDYARAHAIWSGGRSLAAFRRGYAHTRWAGVTPLPPFTVEGGAGSSYATVGVRVDALLDNGVRQRFRGAYRLRRVNDVPGSTAVQRRWRVEGATLTRTR
jgi:hypothetical protein